MGPEPSDYWNELDWLAERHKALVAAKEALSAELLREVEDYWSNSNKRT